MLRVNKNVASETNKAANSRIGLKWFAHKGMQTADVT